MMRNRVVRLLLAAVLAPVLLITAGQSARAAGLVISDSVGVTIEIEGLAWGYGDLTCHVSAATSSTGVIFMGGGFCVGRADLSPGTSQPGEVGSTIQQWVTGSGCQGKSPSVTLTDHDLNGWNHVAGTVPETQYFASEACDPELICIVVKGEDAGPLSGSTYSECAAILLDPVTDEPNVCSGLTVVKQRPLGGPVHRKHPTQNRWFWYQDWSYSVTVGDAAVNLPQFTIYAVKQAIGGGTLPAYYDANGVASNTVPANQYAIDYVEINVTGASVGTSIEGTHAVRLSGGGPTGNSDPGATVKSLEVVGVGYYGARMSGGTTGWYTVRKDSSPNGKLGTTDTANCDFYWGLKISDYSINDTDEPLGDLASPPSGLPDEGPPTEPTSDPEGSCAGFSFTDPTTWAGSGTCMLVALMAKVLDAVLGIAQAILNGLAALFVPSPGSWGFDGLLDQFQTRPPGSVVVGLAAGMQSFIDGYSGSGCGLLADFTSEDLPGASITCSNVQAIPGYSALYTLVQMGMLGLTGISVFRTMAGKVGGDD